MSYPFESALVDYLRNDAGLSALIGQRIYPLVLPDPPTSPALVYQLITGTGDVAHDGPLDLSDARYQFDSWSETYTGAKRVSAALQAALLGFRGEFGGDLLMPWQPGESWRATIPAKPRSNDFFERETGLYRVSDDYRMWIRPD
jgi:hypothetical protein